MFWEYLSLDCHVFLEISSMKTAWKLCRDFFVAWESMHFLGHKFTFWRGLYEHTLKRWEQHCKVVRKQNEYKLIDLTHYQSVLPADKNVNSSIPKNSENLGGVLELLPSINRQYYGDVFSNRFWKPSIQFWKCPNQRLVRSRISSNRVP